MWERGKAGGGVRKLSKMSDASINGPVTDQVLTYDGVAGKWINKMSTVAVINSPLMGLKIGIIGSSSTDPTTDGAGNFPKHVADRTGCVLNNKAITGQTTDQIVLQVATLDADLDLVFAMPGANDDRLSNADGKGNPGTFADRLPTNTFYAQLHDLANKIMAKYDVGKTKIAWSTPPHYAMWTEGRPIDPNYVTNQFHEAIKNVGNYYGFPVLDAVHEGNTPFHLASFKAQYVQADQLHLNNAGNKILSYRVEAFWLLVLQSHPKFVT